MSEAVNHPKHYNVGKIEVIEIIEDWKCDFWIGNCIKYALRSPYKGHEVQDLNKAIWYLQDKVRRLESQKARQSEQEEIALAALK